MPIIETIGPQARTAPKVARARKPSSRFPILPMPNLEWNEEVARETAHLYERVKNVVPSVEWPFFAPYVSAINELKKERNAVILAHNYQTPEIYHCVADVVGDCLQLAREAAKADADVIVQGGVHFMAETSKILNPDKTVLIPDLAAGCSLAVLDHGRRCAAAARALPRRACRHLRQHLGRGEGGERHLLHLGQRRAGGGEPRRRPGDLPAGRVSRQLRGPQTKVKIIAWKGRCEVHERFTGDELRRVSRERSLGTDHRASGMPARRDRGSRLHRLDLAA